MKLLLCKTCQDVVKPIINKERSCQCGACKIVGHSDNVTVTYSGNSAVLIGFKNSSLVSAVVNQPEVGQGREFVAFVLPKNCVSTKKEELSLIEKQNKYLEQIQEVGLEIADSWTVVDHQNEPVKFCVKISNGFNLDVININVNAELHRFIVRDRNNTILRWSNELSCAIDDNTLVIDTDKLKTFKKRSSYKCDMLPTVLKCLKSII